MSDITHASAAQCLLADLEAMEIGPHAMAASSAAKNEAEVVIASYVQSMGGEDERSAKIAADAASYIVKQVDAALTNPIGDEMQEYHELIRGISDIFDREGLSSYYE